MGIVYEAEQKGADDFVKRVAVKLIREEYSKIDEFRNNFVGEARLVADLIHTNIVQTYHLGEISGQYFMTMEYVDGVTLEDFIQRHRETKQLYRQIYRLLLSHASAEASPMRINVAITQDATSASFTAMLTLATS